MDYWAAAGVEGAWTSTHRTPRRAMFTPHRIAGGPGRDIKLEKIRVTVGTFVVSGEQFKIVDQYTEPRAAHMMLEHAWVGTTEFQEMINYEGANIAASTRRADWDSDEEFEGFDAAASLSTHVGKSEKRQSETGDSTRRALLPLTARVPLQREPLAGGRRGGRACTGSAISSLARSSGWINGGCEFESRGLFSICPPQILVRPSPTSSTQVFSSETQVVGEGEYKTDNDRLGETGSECCTLACQTQTVESFGERAGARADIVKTLTKRLRRHLAQGETSGQNSCAAAQFLSGLAALRSLL